MCDILLNKTSHMCPYLFVYTQLDLDVLPLHPMPEEQSLYRPKAQMMFRPVILNLFSNRLRGPRSTHPVYYAKHSHIITITCITGAVLPIQSKIRAFVHRLLFGPYLTSLYFNTVL